MTRLFLVDDHEVVRRGLTELFDAEDDMEVVGEAGTVEQALARVASARPDVAVLDLRLPDGDGVEVCREIRSAHPEVQCLILTSYADDEAVFNAVMAGAAGYLLKDASHDELMSTLRRVQAGQAQIAPSVTRKLVREFASMRQAKPEPAVAPQVPVRPPGLSPREYEVLSLLVRGWSNRQIANELFIDETTVKTHLHRIFEKLHVRDRTQAAILAVQRGWCPQAPA